jgi:hypothetical protein
VASEAAHDPHHQAALLTTVALAPGVRMQNLEINTKKPTAFALAQPAIEQGKGGLNPWADRARNRAVGTRAHAHIRKVRKLFFARRREAW